jgi:hypothetical protein
MNRFRGSAALAALTMVLWLLGGSPALAAPSISGTTSQGQPITLSVQSKRVKAVSFAFTAPCPGYGTLARHERLPTVSRGSRFAVLLRDQGFAVAGTRGKETIGVSGTLKGRRAAGTIKVHAAIQPYSSGAKCSSTITFSVGP